MRDKTGCKNQDLWLTSYADLVTAIVSVLVLMVSFSQIDIEKYDSVQRLLVEKESKDIKFIPLKSIKEKLETTAVKNNLQDIVSLTLDKKGLTINFDSAAQFKPNSHELLQEKIAQLRPIFDEIANASATRYVDIAGYTDDIPRKIGTNWELSALRALAIQQYLSEIGANNKNIRLIAYAENEPLEKVNISNTVEAEKARAKNRRVSIVIRDMSNK